MTVHFFAINNIGKGLSGGDSIWINLAKRWDATVHGSAPAIRTLSDSIEYNLNNVYWITDYEPKNKFSKWGIFTNTVVKLYKGVQYVWRNRRQFNDDDILYSVSDFAPDFMPVLLMKWYNPKLKWVAGFYLFAPSPWGSTYRGDRLRGLGYWLCQRVSYPLIKRWADCVFVTSDIDRDKFPKTVVVRGGV